MSNTEQLLPCPFCGGEAVYFPQEYPDKTFHAVKCKNCYIVWEGHPTKSAAIEKWNTRAALSPPQAVDEKGIREADEELYPFKNENDRHHLENVIAKHEQDAYIKGRLQCPSAPQGVPCTRCGHFYTGEPTGKVLGPDNVVYDCPECDGSGIAAPVSNQTDKKESI
jgi:Lar family restriction alleviation protein